ncbi:MAG: four helix bundle protein, partial [Labilithrix sp.]|nr:four helix bundle protein [Labilithrix sp.]
GPFADERRVEMLRIHLVIRELVRMTAETARQIERSDRRLAAQYRDALGSAGLNTVEGSDQRGGRRGAHYSMALGSAREAWEALNIAAGWGYIAEPHEEIREKFNHVIGTLHRVVHPRR